MDPAITAVTTLLRSQIQGAGIDLHCDLGGGELALHGHRAQFQQVIMNLLINAIEAVKEGAPERGRIMLRSWHDVGADEVRVAVKDNGAGIDPVVAPRLFEAFVSAKPQGIGVGLSICSSIVAAHGGRIWCETEPGQGACFHLALSSAPAAGISKALGVDRGRSRAGMAHLIAASSVFRLVGQAENGASAVAAYIALRPDVVLMDLNMPEMNGLEAIGRIRQFDADARIAVIASYQGDENVYRALHCGASGYLLKDCSAQEIASCIEAVAAGGTYIPARLASKVASRIQSTLLTARERDVLWRREKATRSLREIPAFLPVLSNFT